MAVRNCPESLACSSGFREVTASKACSAHRAVWDASARWMVALTVAALFLMGLSLAINVPRAGGALEEGAPASAAGGTAPSSSAHLRAVAAIRLVFPASTEAAAIRVARCETGGTFNPRAVGRAGERGLFQIHPVHFSWAQPHRLFDPVWNSRVAFRLSRGGTNWRPWTCKP